jgi:hypothetical protein
MNDFNLTEEHIKIEDFKENISIENLNNFIKNNKLFINLHKLQFDELNNEIFNKYIELFIHEGNIDNTYFMQLENYINYFDENSLESIGNINEIDSSFYAKNKIKEYLFMVNFLSDFYKSKYKQKKEYNNNVIDTKTINIKFKKTLTNEENIVSIFSLNNIEYIPIELLFRNESTSVSYNNAKIKYIKINDLEKTQLNVNEKREYTESFVKLFNKIKFKDINDLNKNIDYYYSVLQSYKYKYYDVLLNYNIIQLYYVYIKINGQNENTNLVKYQEIFKLLEIFNSVLLNNELKFNQLNVVMNTVDKLDSKAESEKIEDAKYSMNKLKEINYNLLQNQDYIRNNYKQVEVTQKDINTNTNKIIVISLLLALTFITYAISINYYTLDTSKILSVIIISIIVIVILVNNYIIKTKTYENFEFVEETTETEDVTTDELIKILESDTGSLTDAYEKMAALQSSKSSIEIGEPLELVDDLSPEINRENVDAQLLGNQLSEQRIKTNREKIQKAYNKLISEELSEGSALDTNIVDLQSELARLNREYASIKAREQTLIGIKSQMEESLDIATINVGRAETQIIEKMQTIDDMSTLLGEYLNMNNDLHVLILQKEKIKDLKLKKIDEINKFNIELLRKIEEKSKDNNENKEEIYDLDSVLSYLIFDIDQLNKEKQDFENKTTVEEYLIINLDLEIKTQMARYSKVADKVTQQMAKIANLKDMIENEDMAIQKLAKKIIELENKNKIRAQQSETMAIKATEEAQIAFKILKEKIQKIKNEIENRPKPIKYKLKLNLNFGIAGDVNTSKRYNFKNEILLELSKLLLIPLNRFKIDNIEKGSINIYLVFYPSRTYDSRDLSNEQLISKLEQILSSEEVNNKLLNTKYLKFTMEISKLDDSLNVVEGTTKLLNTSKYLNTDNIVSKIINFFDKNSIIIKNIENIITQLENEKRNPNTYYNEINPKLNLEVKKYSEKDLKINNNQNILNSKTDILVHDYINSDYIYKYLSYITLLFALVFLSYSYLNNYMLVIYIITVIIFLVILLNLYLDIYKNVRRKSKKQYWTKPNKI